MIEREARSNPWVWTLAALTSGFVPSPAAAGPISSSTVTSSTSLDPSAAELRALEEAFGHHEHDDHQESPDPLTPPPSGALSTIAAALQSMNPDMSFILDVAGGWFSNTPLQVGAHDPNRTGFTFQQLELSVSASVDPFFRFNANLVFAEFGVEVEEAYATSTSLPWQLQLRAGQFLTPFGRQNQTHPHSWSFMDQPLVLGKFFGGEGSRGLGAEISWLTPLPWFTQVTVAVNQAGLACCARSFFGGDDLGVRNPADLLYTGRLVQFFAFDDDWSLMFGVSGQTGPNPTGNGNRSGIVGTDLYLRYRPVSSPQRSALTLQVEALWRSRQVPQEVLRDFGIYGQVVWKLTPQWETGARFEWVTGTGGDYLDPQWTEDRRRYAVQATYYPSHFSRVRLQGGYDDPRYQDAGIWSALINLEIVVGAHGSHDY